MRRLPLPAAALALLLVAAVGPFALAHEDHRHSGHPLVDSRQGGMTMMVSALGAVGRVAESGGSVSSAAFPASGLAAFARGLPALFPPETATVTGTASRPEIWEDAEGFASSVAEFTAATSALEAAARADDRESFAEALARTKAACQSCHDSYRMEPAS